MINQKIRAELEYNPYLQTTKVLFNGNEPRINSLVEKYRGFILSDWVQEIPSLFHDEMNGYDFELEFTGTELDFEEVKRAFAEEGITEEQVRVFHKASLEARTKKVDRIKELFEWLKQNPNENFEYEGFWKQHAELNVDTYPLVLIDSDKGEKLVDHLPRISVEIIDTLTELDNTDLAHTPIVIKINRGDLTQMQRTFDYFLKRQDVSERQLFFILSPDLNEEVVTRTIQDLGVQRPKIIHSLGDELVRRFFLTYPVTDYIVEVIKCLREELDKLKIRIKAENEDSERTNSEIHERLRALTDDIVRIKDADEAVVYRDNLDLPSEYSSAIESLLSAIETWNKRKTKIATEADADISATQFVSAIIKEFNDFIDKVKQATSQTCERIENALRSAYRIAEADPSFQTDGVILKQMPELSIPLERREFLKLKEEEYVVPKDGVFLFKQTEEKEPVLETTYYTQNWREYAVGIMKPIADEVVSERYDALCEYNTKMTDMYHSHLQKMIADKIAHREKIAQLLSDEEKQLEIDNKWVNDFAEQIENLGRR